MLDFELEADALAVFVADEFEGDVPWGAWEVVLCAVEINGGEKFFTALDAEADVLFFEDIGAVDGGDGAGVKYGGRVTHAAGFEQGEFFEVTVFKIGHVDVGVEFEAWDKVLKIEASAGCGGELLAEAVKVVPCDAESGGHVVSAEGPKKCDAITEGFDEG